MLNAIPMLDRQPQQAAAGHAGGEHQEDREPQDIADAMHFLLRRLNAVESVRLFSR